MSGKGHFKGGGKWFVPRSFKDQASHVHVASEKVQKSDYKLYSRLNPKSARNENNGYEWRKKWIERSSSKYGPKVHNSIKIMKYPEDIDDNYDEFVYDAENPTDRESWLPTVAEQEELEELIEDEVGRVRKKFQMFTAWKRVQLTENAAIKSRNKLKDEKRALQVKENNHGPTIKLQILGAA